MVSAVRDLKVALDRPGPTELPFHILLTRSQARDLLALAEHGLHALASHVCAECGVCIDCDDNEPPRCTHQPLCSTCWPGLCWVCQAEAEAGGS